MQRTACLASLLVVAGSALTASAGITVNGASGAGWRDFPGVLNDYNNAQRPFWDQRSMDTGNRNIGNYLNGSYAGSLPSGAAPSPNITPRWWGANAAELSIGGQQFTGDPGMHFTLAGPGVSATSTMLLEVAGNSQYNEIGWYNTADALGAETLHPIYSGTSTPGATAAFTPSADFGLYIRSYRNYPGANQGLLFFTETMRNRANGPAALAANDLLVQHFATFQTSAVPGAERYIVGVEDLPLRSSGIESFGDYNDVVFTIQAVPTPGTVALLGAGGLMAGRRRRR